MKVPSRQEYSRVAKVPSRRVGKGEVKPKQVLFWGWVKDKIRRR
jgi:hypothetical protein